MIQDQLKPTCQQCFREKFQEVLAKHWWDKGFLECHKWLCQTCYWEEQMQWIIWEEQEKQAITNYLIESEESVRKYLKQNK